MSQSTDSTSYLAMEEIRTLRDMHILLFHEI